MASDAWKPDMVVGVDFGMTSTGVAYSFGPEWARPETIQHWPGTAGSGLADKVETAVAYDGRTNQVVSWGFTVDPDDPHTRIEERFKLFLDPGFHDENHEDIRLEDARTWYTDFLTALYRYLTRTFGDTIPRWPSRRVEWVFSVPTTWKDPAMIAETKQLIRDAGFGTVTGHRLEISLTEAEAAAVYVSKQQYERGDVFLVCDAGGGTTDVNILKMASSEVGKVLLEPLSHVEGAPIGSTLIDYRVDKMIVERLESIRHQLVTEPWKIAERMMRGRFETFKCSFGEYATELPRLYLPVPGLPPGFNSAVAHIHDSRMVITREELQKIFDDQINRIFRLVDNELSKLQTTHMRESVSYLVLSGGLGSSPYVQKKMKLRYERNAGNYPNANDLRILKAPKPQLAVVHGLVIDRVQRITQDQEVYRERCCRNSYGIVVRQLFDPIRHQGEEITIDPRDKRRWAENQIDWFIKKGESIVVADGVKQHYKLKLDPESIASPWRTQIVMTAASQLPKSLLSENVKTVCWVESQLSSRDLKRKNRHWYNHGPTYYRAEFDMRVIIGAADLQFEMIGNDGIVSRGTSQVDVQWTRTSKKERAQELADEPFGGIYREDRAT